MGTRILSNVGTIALGLICLLVGWVSVSALAAPAPALDKTRYHEMFSDGVREFCTDQSPVNISSPMHDSQFAGYESKEVAASAFVNEVRATAAAPNADPEHAQLLVQALAPSAKFQFNSSRAADQGVTYFDYDAEGDGLLEARLVVYPWTEGRFVSGESYICDSQLVVPSKALDYYEAVEVGE
jgi:hypothetical protein